jgi:glucan 1,3-beta-glucosidase
MFTSTTLTILLTLAGFLPAVLSFSPNFPYGSEKVRGVSIGGWLVLEVRFRRLFLCLCIDNAPGFKPWITPSIFENTGNPDIIDEWTFGEKQDPNVATDALTNHWDSFITEDDFAKIAAAGYV